MNLRIKSLNGKNRGMVSGSKSGSVVSTNIDELYLLSRRYLEIKNKPYRREMVDHKNCFKHRLSILVGQRGVGKTTIIIQHLLDQAKNNALSTEILYVPSDHFLLDELSLYEIADTFSKLGGKIIAFDEIHKYPNWSEELKSIYDTFPDLKIIASSSSSLKIYKGSHDLTRRSAVYSIKGLSLREYLNLTLNLSFAKYSLEDILANHPAKATEILKKCKDQKILVLFKKYLTSGYYPYFLEINDENTYLMTLEQNFHTIIESDLPAIYPSLTGNSIRKIKQLLNFIASSVPFTPQMNKLKNIIEVGDERTLKEYLKYLEDAGLIRMLMQASKKIRKIEVPEKIYLDNPNQLYAFSTGKQNQNIGTIREIFFLTMLSHGHEVTAPKTGDFLIDNKIVIEVGGKNKSFDQVKHEKKSFLALDEIEHGIGQKIPLWLFGFLY